MNHEPIRRCIRTGMRFRNMNANKWGIMVIVALVIIVSGSSEGTFAQQTGQVERSRLQERVRRAEAEVDKLGRDLRTTKTELSGKVEIANSKVETLQKQLVDQGQKVEDLGRQLGTQIASAESKSSERFQAVDGTISRNTVVAILAVAVALVLSALLYLILRRRLNADKIGLIDTIQRNRQELEEEGLKMDNKLVDLLATQMALQKQPVEESALSSGEIDHSLALKVADEIVRIEKNLVIMDPDIRGFKQLNAAVRRIRDSFAAKGYELVEMLNQRYDPGMKVIANFRPDETLGANEQIITRIIKPQVNFNGVMIQAAQIEVSQGD